MPPASAALLAALLAAPAPCVGESPTSEDRVKIEALRKLKAKDSPKSVEYLATALAKEASAPVREEIVRTLASGRHAGPRAAQALGEAMSADPSPGVRAEAASAMASFTGGEGASRIDRYLQEERNEEARARVCLALATVPAHIGDPETTLLLSKVLLDDPSRLVRRAALTGLELRKDRGAFPALARAAKLDSDGDIRRDAARLLKGLERAAKPKPQTKAPARASRPGAVKGVDDCPNPLGWCECTMESVSKIRPRCQSLEDCQSDYENSFRRNGYACTWNGRSLD
jgi:hypothetical protein